MPPSPQAKLTRREREIMDAILSLGGRASAEEIRERLSDPPSYSAVRAMLVRLEGKGHLRHFEEGLRYIYSPTKSRASAQRGAIERLMRVFFDGSPLRAATALLKEEAWTPEELDSLSQEITRARKGRRNE
jgi:BlaI family transcriptional regulator, penicillinase repressor